MSLRFCPRSDHGGAIIPPGAGMCLRCQREAAQAAATRFCERPEHRGVPLKPGEDTCFFCQVQAPASAERISPCIGCGEQDGSEDGYCYDCADYRKAWDAAVALQAIEYEYGVGSGLTDPIWAWIGHMFNRAQLAELRAGTAERP